MDGTNHAVWRWSHDAFGRGAPDQRPSGSSKDFVYNQRFPGQTYDAETGFFYNLNRYYDPATGRYTRPDPIGLDGGMNPYAYVGGNPVTNVDPSGLENVNLQRLSILERSGQSGSEIWWKIADIISTIGESVQREASGAIDWCGSALVSSAEIAPSVAAGAPVPVVGVPEVLSLTNGYLGEHQDPDDINRYVNNNVELMEKREKEHLSRLQYLRDPAP